MMSEDRFDRKLFKHSTDIRVRNYEVDWQGIVHNAVYLLYFEVGRIEYFKRVGVRLDQASARGKNRIVLVRNEIDYRMPVTFDASLRVHTRVSRVKNTSFWMEGLLEKTETHEVVSTNVAFHVWLDEHTGKPRDVGDAFRKQIMEFEGQHCAIHWPVRDT